MNESKTEVEALAKNKLAEDILNLIDLKDKNLPLTIIPAPTLYNNEDYINYADDECFYDIQERIEAEKINAFLDVKNIVNNPILNSGELLACIQDKLEFDKVNAEFNISLEKDNIADSKFCEFLFNAHSHIITQYVVKNNIGLLKVDEAKDKSIWCGSSCNSSSQSIPDSLDSLESTLSRLKPAKIVYLQSTDYASNLSKDSAFGFGLYLFDEADNLISKLVYKFIDESIAPENARRLSTPTTFEQFDDRSRPFF